MLTEIENIICIGERINPPDIHVRSRNDKLKETRQIIMFFAKEIYPSMTWQAIADYFGLDHATSMHAIKTIRKLMQSDVQFRKKIKYYRSQLSSLKIEVIKKPITDEITILEFNLARSEQKVSELKNSIEALKVEIRSICDDNDNDDPDLIVNNKPTHKETTVISKVIPKQGTNIVEKTECLKTHENSVYTNPYKNVACCTSNPVMNFQSLIR